jgi:hypothetical protein
VDLPRRRLAVEQQLGRRLVEGLAEQTRTRVVVVLAEVVQRGGERQELAQGVPAQVSLGHELLDALGGGAPGPRLEEAAAGHERHDRQHLRARTDLEDREEVGEVVAQHVPRDRDRVLAAPDALEGEAGGLLAPGTDKPPIRCRIR